MVDPTATRSQVKPIFSQGEGYVRRNDIDVPGLGDETLVNRHGGHRGFLAQQLSQKARVIGVQVLDDDKGHVAAPRQGGQKLRDRFETAGGSADRDDRKSQSRPSCRPTSVGSTDFYITLLRRI